MKFSKFFLSISNVENYSNSLTTSIL